MSDSLSGTDRTHEDLRELLGVYALDAVEPDEAAAVEAHLAGCPQCRAEVEEHRSVASLLGNVGAAAPIGLWDRISDSLDEPGAEPASPSGEDVLSFPVGGRAARPAQASPSNRHPVRTVLGAVAAAVVLLAGVAGVLTIRDQQQQVDDLAAEVASARVDQSAAEALTDPTSTVVRLTSPDDDTEVRAVVTEDGVGYLLGGPLPAVGSASTYQLWGLTGTSAISLGVLGREPEVVEFHVEGPISTLAITTERRGGVDQSSNDPLVIGDIDDASTVTS